MFNNAGIGGAVGPLENITVEDWDRTQAVCLRGVFLGIKHAVAPIRAAGGGSIISTASIAGIQGFPNLHAYSAAKAGVVNLTRSAALEFACDRIRVNCIAPGGISTPILYGFAGATKESIDAALAHSQPYPRAGPAGGHREYRVVPRERCVAVHHRADAGRRWRRHCRADRARAEAGPEPAAAGTPLCRTVIRTLTRTAKKEKAMRLSQRMCWVAVLGWLLVGVGHAAPQAVDLLFVNGKVVTVDEHFSIHSTLAVKDGVIVAVGDAELANDFAAARTIDLHGRTLMPGFIDTHLHLQGRSHRAIDAAAARSIADLQRMIREKAAQLGPGEWITGYGWDEAQLSDGRNPTRADLDAAAPKNPVELVRAGSHSAVGNSEALRLAGITKDDAGSAERHHRARRGRRTQRRHSRAH